MFAVVVAPAQAGTLDQQQPVSSSQFGVGNCGSNAIAQTFTAGITGALDQVDVFVFRNETNLSEPLTVEIHSTVDGAPSGRPRFVRSGENFAPSALCGLP